MFAISLLINQPDIVYAGNMSDSHSAPAITSSKLVFAFCDECAKSGRLFGISVEFYAPSA